MKLVLHPDERLNQPCNEIEKITPELIKLAKDMYVFMRENNGIGLAANQVGETICLIVVHHDNKPLYMFNPKIVKAEQPGYNTEGCLSFPNVIKNCRRHQKIMVQYRGIDNKIYLGKYQGLTARCIQHECDHLKGITFDERE